MIGLYCPDLPPVRGGVSDHTLVLARALEARGHPPAVLGHQGDPRRFAPLDVRLGVTPSGVGRAARELGLSAIIVQYVPFLFARRGVSPAFCFGVRTLARARLRIGVVLHEPYVPFTRLPWLVTGWPMRWQLRYLLRHAAFVYAPVPRYVEIARRYVTRATVKLAPIGATLPVSTASREEARRRLGIAPDAVAVGSFSPAAAGFRRDWIEEACQRLASDPRVIWVSFGFGHQLVPQRPPTQLRVIRVPDTNAETVTRTMRALDIAAAPYVDGLTMRRSGAMLALAHGIPLVSSTGHLFDERLADLAACESSSDAFASRLVRLVGSDEDRAALAKRARGYRAVGSVEVLAEMIAGDLGGARS